jgi:hypothetical protein
MDGMPLDVNILVAEQVRGVVELCQLRLVSRCWAGAVDLALEAWVRSQPVGVPLEPFSKAELGMGMRMVANQVVPRGGTRGRMFRSHALSLSCEVDLQRTVLWRLTRESGRVPACVNTESCGCNKTGRSSVELRKPYFVVKSHDVHGDVYAVHITSLQVETVRHFVNRVLPAARDASRRDPDRVFRAMCLGGWTSAVQDCLCCVGTSFVCLACEAPDWESVEEAWVTRSTFKGFLRSTSDELFAGVTDSVGSVKKDGSAWLQCVRLAQGNAE